MAAPCGELAVVGVDLTPASAVLVERLGVLSRIGVRHLTLVHVLGGHYPQIPQLRHAAHDASRLEQLARRAEHRFTVSTEVRTGQVADQLEQAARCHGAGLVAVGARGRTPLRGLLLGSTVLDLAVHAHRPVLLIPVLREPAGQRDDGGVLVATDASPAARQAERLGTALAALIGGQAITVVPAEESGVDDLSAAEERVRALAHAERLTARGLPCTVEVGGVPETIARVADERAADLIVLGCGPHGALEGLVRGPTGEHALHHARRPVLLVPAPAP